MLYIVKKNCLLAQSELLELSSSIFLSCGVHNMRHESSSSLAWGALKDDTLVQFATNFLSHNIKLLSVFVHIIEQREPEMRDKVSTSSLSCSYGTLVQQHRKSRLVCLPRSKT